MGEPMALEEGEIPPGRASFLGVPQQLRPEPREMALAVERRMLHTRLMSLACRIAGVREAKERLEEL